MNGHRAIKFNYLYIDGGNFKAFGEVVFPNPDGIPCANIDVRLRRVLDMGCLFIADQIHIPEIFLYVREELIPEDHCFHEFDSVEESTDRPTDKYQRSINSFVVEVEKQSRRGWNAFNPIDRLFDIRRSV